MKLEGDAPTTVIWSFNRRLSQRLMVWALASIGGGLLLARGQGARRGFGVQMAGWGLINGAIATIGQANAELKQGSAAASVEVKQARSLRRLLWINTALDVGYMAGGLWWAQRSAPGSAGRGHGVAVVVQGLFLFLFDLIHARRVPRLDEPEQAGGDRVIPWKAVQM